MKCGYCGHEIPEGKLYCEKCGREVCIVPDYNPLEDMLTQQIRGAISGGDGYEDYLEYDAGRNVDPRGRNIPGRDTGRGAGRSTSRDVRGGTGRNTGGVSRSTSRDVRGGTGRNTGGVSRSTSRDVRGGTGRNYAENPQDRERKRRQAERRKAKRRMRMGCFFMIFLLIAAIIGSGVTLYMNSYKGFVDRGNKALRAGAYNEAD